MQRDPVPSDVDTSKADWKNGCLPIVRRLWKGLTQIPTVSQWLLDSGSEHAEAQSHTREGRGSKPKEVASKADQPKDRHAAARPASALPAQPVKKEPNEEEPKPLEKGKDEQEQEVPGLVVRACGPCKQSACRCLCVKHAVRGSKIDMFCEFMSVEQVVKS